MGTRSHTGLALSLSFSAALALFGAPRAASAGKSHLLQKVERHVVLASIPAPGVDQCTNSFEEKVLAEILADGTAASAEFVVPSGHVLVVTEIDWSTAEGPTDIPQGRVHIFSIALGPANPPVFQRGAPIDADLAAAGITSGSASLTTGFRVYPGVPICPRATSETSGGSLTNSVTSLIVRGYLVKSK